MKITAEIFNGLTADMGEYTEYNDIEPARDKEQEELFEKMSGEFKSTLNEHQAEALEAILDVGDSVGWNRYYQGIVLGFILSKALTDFMNNPIAALKIATENYTSVNDANGYAIRILNKYFEKYSVQGGKR